MLLKKLMTALKGNAVSAGEAIVDSQALTILRQELREAKDSLNTAKEQRNTIMGQRNLAQREVDAIEEKIAQSTSSLDQALELGKDDLAEKVAEQIAQLDGQLATATANRDQYKQTAASMEVSIQDTEKRVRELEQSLAHVTATDAAQRAQATVAAAHAGQSASLNSASESLERLKEKQALQAEKFKVAREEQRKASGEDLADELAAAGIGPSAKPTTASILAERRKALAAKADSPSE